MSVTQFTASSGILLDGVNFSNGTLDVNGTADAIILDADGDTTISAPTDDQIDIEIGGSDDFTITSNSFNVLSGSTIAGPSSTFYWCAPIAAQQDISGPGAVNITTAYTAITTTGTNDAFTLVDGVVKGHYKKIQLVVDGGDAILTPSNLSGGTTITFADIGDTAELVFDGTNWVVISLFNCADGTSAPVLA